MSRRRRVSSVNAVFMLIQGVHLFMAFWTCSGNSLQSVKISPMIIALPFSPFLNAVLSLSRIGRRINAFAPDRLATREER